MLIVPPAELGLPESFAQWRGRQDEAIFRAIDSEQRFIALCLPTGFGKSITAMGYAQQLAALNPSTRVVYLTSTRALQDQIDRDFGSVDGFTDVRGKSNYNCTEQSYSSSMLVSAEYRTRKRTCEDGHRGDPIPCGSISSGGCPYKAAAARARTQRFVVTNYSYYLSANEYGDGVGSVDVLICDEAHELPEEVAAFLRVTLKKREIESVLQTHMPRFTFAPEWKEWAEKHVLTVKGMLDSASEPSERVRLNELYTALDRAATRVSGEWVVEVRDTPGPGAEVGDVSIEPVWPGPYTESVLFRGVKKVLLLSATLRPKMLQLMNLKKSEVEWVEYPSTFPVKNRPVIFIKSSPRLSSKSSDSDLRVWASKIDNIIRKRLDRKGIIHTVSYKRAKELAAVSEFSRYFILPSSFNTRVLVEEFRRAPAPSVLVSPAVTTGYDFPFDQAQYQIIAKLPFPDSRNPVMEARQKQDGDYPMLLTMLSIVQAAGRGVRGPTDRCETFIVDGQWAWFHKKFRAFAPQWFFDACSTVDLISSPAWEVDGEIAV